MNKVIKIGQIPSSYDMSGRVYSVNGISPTVMSNSHGKTDGGYNPIKILVLDTRNNDIFTEVSNGE